MCLRGYKVIKILKEFMEEFLANIMGPLGSRSSILIWVVISRTFFARRCQVCQLNGNRIHTSVVELHNFKTHWLFHTWALDLIRLINPSYRGHMRILNVIEYYTKWVETMSLKRASGVDVTNFIRENDLASLNAYPLTTVLQLKCARTNCLIHMCSTM